MAILFGDTNAAHCAAPPRRRYGKGFAGTRIERTPALSTEPRAAPSAGRLAGPPRWTGKPVRRLTTAELAEALEYLERHRPDDDVLGRALAAEFARRTAAAEFARRAAADRRDTLEGGPGRGWAPGQPRPAWPDLDGRRPPLPPRGRPRNPQ
ncbi:hypothetical protein [Actinomadura mexicana]|uniref:hypothetical protein n=1 Tax=Actinomadura mexicana TaxID=134959 RepID=UPI001178B770|nr:hypothetical protein [Actinomadura mexicana]